MEADNGGAQNCSPTTLVLFPIPMAYEQSSRSAIQNDEHMDRNVKGEEGILQESDHSETLKEFKSGENVAEGEEDLASDGHFLGKEDTGDHTIEFRNLGNESSLKAFDDLCKTNGMVTKEMYYKSDLAIGLGDFDTLQSSQRAEIAGENVGYEDLDCEQCLIPSNPVDLSTPTTISASNGTLEPNIIPSYFESEFVLRISAYTSSFHPASRSEDIMSDSKHRENFVEIDLNMASDPPLVEEEDKAPPLLQLASSMQPSVRGIDLNDDPSNFDFVPVLTALDSRMIIDKMDELSARAFITSMEYNTPSWCWISDMNPDYGMMQRENGGSEEGSLMHLFMAESGNHWGEERKSAKRKEPDSGLDPDDSGHSQLRLKL